MTLHLFGFTFPSGLAAWHLLGLSLLHFLWQSTLLALLLSAALIPLRKRAARIRYLSCCLTLAAMTLAPVLTMVFITRPVSKPPGAIQPAAHIIAGPVAQPAEWQPASSPVLRYIAAAANRAISWLPALWIPGVLLLLARAVAAGIAAHRLRIASVAPAPGSLLALAEHTQTRLSVRSSFQIFVSEAVTVPTVIGWLKPAILFPLASLASLSPEQLETMVAHELAHVRRRDYLLNAFQIAIEALLFYHPAVWWVSSQIRREREYCCDDIAVAAASSPLVYAKALYLLEEQRSITPQLMLGGNGGQLTMRIQRLLTGKQPAPGSWSTRLWLTSIALSTVSALLVVSSGTTVTAAAHSADPPATAAATAAPAANAATAKMRLRTVPEDEARQHLLAHDAPVYPPIAQAAHVEGDVSIMMTIDSAGRVIAARVVSGPPMLQGAALDSVKHYRFTPFSDAGPEQSVTTTLTVPFALQSVDISYKPASSAKSTPKPDLSCTFYDHGAEHPGTCELHADSKELYFCRQNDEDRQTQLQVGCKSKIEGLQAWEVQNNDK